MYLTLCKIHLVSILGRDYLRLCKIHLVSVLGRSIPGTNIYIYCKVECQALKRAIALEDTHAACQIRMAITSRAMAAISHGSKLLARTRDDLRRNSHRLALYIKRGNKRNFVQDLASWSQYCGSLFEVRVSRTGGCTRVQQTAMRPP